MANHIGIDFSISDREWALSKEELEARIFKPAASAIVREWERRGAGAFNVRPHVQFLKEENQTIYSVDVTDGESDGCLLSAVIEAAHSLRPH